jgi:hypothetical protein
VRHPWGQRDAHRARAGMLALLSLALAGCEPAGAPADAGDPEVAEENAADAPAGMRVTADTQVIQLPQPPAERP